MTGKIILIDAYAQIYRGFYAVRNLSNSKGQPTNAVFAMAKFLLKIHRDMPGNTGAFIFDCGKPAFRLELAPDYKANRPPMPDDLKAQIPYIERLVTAFGWSAIRREGYEADDLIAALAHDFAGHEVRIISSDKDIHQSITANVHMLVPDRDGGFEDRGPDEVVKKFEVAPGQIIDYLALIGDNSDNIPGVQGVGPKTAAALVKQFGSIDAMLSAPEMIANPKLRDKITAATDILRKNQQLIRLKTDVENSPWAVNDECLSRREPDWQALAALASELELKSILKEINELCYNSSLPMQESPKTPEPAAKPEAKAEQPDLFG